jgi:hypothetical protein
LFRWERLQRCKRTLWKTSLTRSFRTTQKLGTIRNHSWQHTKSAQNGSQQSCCVTQDHPLLDKHKTEKQKENHSTPWTDQSSSRKTCVDDSMQKTAHHKQTRLAKLHGTRRRIWNTLALSDSQTELFVSKNGTPNFWTQIGLTLGQTKTDNARLSINHYCYCIS